jgi:hypothetical protein
VTVLLAPLTRMINLPFGSIGWTVVDVLVMRSTLLSGGRTATYQASRLQLGCAYVRLLYSLSGGRHSGSAPVRGFAVAAAASFRLGCADQLINGTDDNARPFYHYHEL